MTYLDLNSIWFANKRTRKVNPYVSQNDKWLPITIFQFHFVSGSDVKFKKKKKIPAYFPEMNVNAFFSFIFFLFRKTSIIR